MKVTTSAAIYFVIQSTFVFFWWFLLVLVPESRAMFTLEAGSDTSLLAFWLADLSLISAGSLITGWLYARDSEFKQIAAWFVTGAVAYAALYCLAFGMVTDRGWLGIILMLAAMIWSGVFAVGLTFTRQMFRQSAQAPARWIVFKTLLQIVIVWSVILLVIPSLVVIVENKIGITQLHFPGQKPIALILFILASIPGVYAAYTMSTIGLGTPLPLDHAKNLVIQGPYAYVRNPMAVSGICQGLAVALYLGSPLVGLYTMMGSAIWQLVFRPLEEDDLRRRFGQPFDKYRREVKCWIPRLRPYADKAEIGD